MPAATCPNCHQSLAVDGSCPACLLRLALQHTEDSHYPSGSRGADLFGDLPSVEQLNAALPQFDVLRLVGRGGMGGIYQARQRNLDRDVAIKLISPRVSQDPSFVERFDREAKALAKLAHPRIVGIFDYGHTADGLAYLVMEYVDGINLRQAMQLKQIDASEAIELTMQICDALEYAHNRGVVHRDIKPENILIGEDGTLKVADFGIAKLTDPESRTPTLTATRQVLGSLHYLAPEHIENPAAVDHRVDLYAVGVVLYELLTGHLPIGRYEPPSAVVPALGRRIDDVVQQALSRRPQDRFPSALALRTALAEVHSSEPLALDSSMLVTAPSERIAIPFSCEAFGGFAETLGMVYIDQKSLSVEFRTRDVFLRSILSGQIKTVYVPRERLTKVRVTPGVFHSSLTIIADSISALGDLPNAESGQVKLKIKNSDLAEAQAGMRLLGYDERSESKVFHIDAADTPFTASQQITYGILGLACGILNLGFLAVFIILVVQNFSAPYLPVLIIAASLVLGIIATVQIVAGIMHWLGFSRGLASASNIVSLIPITPVWILSGPLALWAWLLMNAHAQEQGKAETAAYNSSALASTSMSRTRGATTLMLLRESRSARLLAWLNALGSVLITVGIVVFMLGLYPVQLKYHWQPARAADAASVVPSSSVAEVADKTEWAVPGEVNNSEPANFPGTPRAVSINEPVEVTAIRRRLIDLGADVQFRSPDELSIRCWKRSAEAITDALTLSGPLQIAWEVDGSLGNGALGNGPLGNGALGNEPQRSDQIQSLPTLVRLPGGARQESSPALLPTLAVHRLQALDRAWIGDLSQVNVGLLNREAQSGVKRQVVMKLTTSGRDWLLKQKPLSGDRDEPTAQRILLVADGLVIGQAELSAVRPDRVTFDVAPECDFSSEALRAALRGPTISGHLQRHR